MSQCGYDPNMKEVYGSRSKIVYEPYTDEELASDEFFWNQLKIIVEMKNTEYLNHFMHKKSEYISRMARM